METMTSAEYQALAKKSKSKNGLRLVTKNPNLEDMKLCLQLAGISFETEYQFLKDRKFRFDIAIIIESEFFSHFMRIIDDSPVKIAIEYEGTISEKSRHTSITGYSKDCEKYNLAQLNGWIVLRYTALNYTTMIDDVRNLLK